MFLLIIASWSNQQQQEVIEYLRTENSVLKKRFGKKRILLNDDERSRLAVKGKILGRKTLSEVGTLFTPDTILRWHRQLVANKWDCSDRKEKKTGRPRTRQVIVDLTVKFAKENPTWGYDRISSALSNVGYHITDTTFYLLFAMELKTRRVSFAGCTTNPNEAWMKTIARELTNHEDGFLKEKKYLIMDRDATFSQSFREFLRHECVKPVRLPPRSPNLNAHSVRFFGSLKTECRYKLILFGENATRRAVRSYVTHYHTDRNHQGLGNELIVPMVRPPEMDAGIETTERLGGFASIVSLGCLARRFSFAFPTPMSD